jgi:hypothetical protein
MASAVFGDWDKLTFGLFHRCRHAAGYKLAIEDDNQGYEQDELRRGFQLPHENGASMRKLHSLQQHAGNTEARPRRKYRYLALLCAVNVTLAKPAMRAASSTLITV